jgi:hypothetical protein
MGVLQQSCGLKLAWLLRLALPFCLLALGIGHNATPKEFYLLA